MFLMGEGQVDLDHVIALGQGGFRITCFKGALEEEVS
jgi:hypothetical protein